MIDYLLAGTVVAAAIQPAGERRAACLTFAGLTIAFGFASVELPGVLCYVTGAVVDLAIISLLDKLALEAWLTRTLQQFCVASIVLNFAGCISYVWELPPSAFDLSFVIFYVLAIMAMIYGGPANAGNRTSRDLFNVRGYLTCGVAND